MKLLLDMNLSPALVGTPGVARFQVVHWAGIGDPAADDTEIFNYARANDTIVITHDLDFSAILAATNDSKPSVVQIRAVNLAPDHLSSLIIAALRQCAAELESGALLTIDAERRRLRLLPLRSGAG